MRKTRIKSEGEYKKMLGYEDESYGGRRKQTNDASAYFDLLREKNATSNYTKNNPFENTMSIQELKEKASKLSRNVDIEEIKAQIAMTQTEPFSDDVDNGDNMSKLYNTLRNNNAPKSMQVSRVEKNAQGSDGYDSQDVNATKLSIASNQETVTNGYSGVDFNSVIEPDFSKKYNNGLNNEHDLDRNLQNAILEVEQFTDPQLDKPLLNEIDPEFERLIRTKREDDYFDSNNDVLTRIKSETTNTEDFADSLVVPHVLNPYVDSNFEENKLDPFAEDIGDLDIEEEIAKLDDEDFSDIDIEREFNRLLNEEDFENEVALEVSNQNDGVIKNNQHLNDTSRPESIFNNSGSQEISNALDIALGDDTNDVESFKKKDRKKEKLDKKENKKNKKLADKQLEKVDLYDDGTDKKAGKGEIFLNILLIILVLVAGFLIYQLALG